MAIPKVYNYNDKAYNQEQMDAMAKKATPDQREMLNKQFGTTYARAEPQFSGTKAPTPT